MTRVITVDGTDVTAITRLDSFAYDMRAHAGEVGAGSMTFDDTTGTADPASAMKEWVITESLASPTTIAGGFIGERRPDRGPLTVGAQRQWTPVLEDYNAAFTDRVLKGTNARRPVETDVERIQWLASTGALGMLDDFVVDTDDPEELEKTSFRGKYPSDVLNDAAENTGKNYYTYFKSGTGWVGFYGPWNQTTAGFTSDLQVSDVLADIDSATVFGASDIEYELDPGRIYSHLVIKWQKGWVTVDAPSTVTNFRNRQKTVVRENFKTAARARTWGRKQLTKLNEEVKRLTLTVNVPASVLGELQARKRIEVKLQSRGITAFTWFRIVGTTFSPRMGEGGNPSDVLYSVRLTMRDKIRPVNIGDIYGDPETTVSQGGSGSGEPGPDGVTSPDSTYDSTEYVIDDFDRGLVASNSTTSTGTTHAINLPADADIIGHTLVMVLANTGTDGIDATPAAQLVALGWVEEFGDSVAMAAPGDFLSYSVLRKVIDGTEGYPATGGTIDVTTVLSESLTAYAETLNGVGDDAPPVSVASNNASANPPSNSPGFVGSQTVRWLSFAVGESAVTGDPAGFSIEQLAGTPLFWRLHSKTSTNASEDPGTYTCTTPLVALTIATQMGGLGVLPPPADGAWWTGGNVYDSFFAAYVGAHGVEDGVFFAESIADPADYFVPNVPSGNNWIVSLYGEDHPDGDFPALPVQVDGWEVTIRYRLLGASGIPADDGLRYVYFDWMFGGRVRINFGDGTNAEGIQVIGESTDTATRPLTPLGDWGLIKWRWQGGEVSAKEWAEGDPEPAYEVTAPLLAAIVETDTEFDIVGRLGNETNPIMRIEIDTYSIKRFAISGERVEQQVIAIGDGVEDTFTVPGGFAAGSAVFWVDGMLTVPTSVDVDAGTATFDLAPSTGAVIAASWTPA